MMRNFFNIIIFLGLMLLFVGNVYAEPKGPEPKGIKVGNVLLHPGAQLSLEYNSNKGHGDGSRTNDSLGDGNINVGATFRSRFDDDSEYDWRTGAEFFWQQFFGAGDANPTGGFVVRASTSADLFKKRIFRMTPNFAYSYLAQPEDENLRQDYHNHFISLGSSFIIQPNEGKIFSQKFSYQLNTNLYTDHGDLNVFDHRIESLTKWNFLPISSLTLHLDQRIIHYAEDVRTSVGAGEEPNVAGFPLRAKLGLQGLLLSRMSYSLGLGYSYTFFREDANDHLFIMHADLGYMFTENISINVGYKKDHEKSTYGNFYKYHRVKLGFDGFFINHLTTSLQFNTSIIDYRSLSLPERRDIVYGLSANIFYHFFAGLKLGLVYRMRINDASLDYGSYKQHVIGLNFAYEY